jgi:alanine dehydrogenase
MARTRGMSVGFPRMHKEAGERRDWLPSVVAVAAAGGREVVVEAGIGSGMGLTDQAYRSQGASVRVGSNAEAFGQDAVVTLRAPETAELTMLRPGAMLVSMLHFATRPARVARLRELGLEAIALDRIVDDAGRRLVVNGRDVARNGVEAAFDVLERTWPGLWSRRRGPVQVVVTGVGAVGRYAVEAATKFGSDRRRDEILLRGIEGAVVHAVGRTVTAGGPTMGRLLAHADVLVDASQRDDPSVPLIPNAWLASLPGHAVVCNLVVDPYLLDAVPPTVRSIEGIPRGDLDQLWFSPDDPHWCDTIPPQIPSSVRRHTVTCYSWPGVHPRRCMELYGDQFAGLLEIVLQAGGTRSLRADGSFGERALARATLDAWFAEAAHGSPRPDGEPSPSWLRLPVSRTMARS